MQLLRLRPIFSLSACLLAGLSLVSAFGAPGIKLVTGTQEPPSTGGGDSHYPLVTPDGRYVLFASTANNLASAGSNTPYAARSPAKLNVYLRDRTNATTRFVTVNLSGTGGGNGDSLPAGISSDGRFALIESSGSDLVSGDTNGVADIFLYDSVSNQTVLVSTSTNGNFANRASWLSTMTPDGRYVAFASAATNLVANDTNGISDIFVRDMQTGSNVLASPGARTGSGSDAPLITPNGRFVAFLSSATNVVPGVSTRDEVYVRDLVAGSTVAVSTNARSFLAGTLFSYNHALSDDGQYVAYQANPSLASTGMIFRTHVPSGFTEVVHSNAPALPSANTGFRRFHNLDLSADGRLVAFIGKSNDTTQVYLWDGQTGLKTLVSQDLSGGAPTNCISDFPVLDESGRFVAFLSTATNLTTNVVADGFHLYVRDLQANTTRLVDANTNGFAAAKDFLSAPRFADAGRLMVFDCADADLTAGDSNYAYDVFLHDGATDVTELVSARLPDLASQTASGIVLDSRTSISADGRFVTFATFPGGLWPNPPSIFRNVFVRDLLNTSNSLVSTATNGLLAANGMCSSPAISGDGRWVVFASLADNLVVNDTNKVQDVFVRDSLNGVTLLVSSSTNGVSPGNNLSSDPVISSNGRCVLFHSRANNLSSGSVGTTNRLFFRDLQTATTHLVSALSPSCATMTPDGRFVAFGGATGNMFVWDSQLVSLVYSNSTPAISNIAISANGNRVAGLLGSRVYVSDRASGTNWVLVTSSKLTPLSHAGLQFSADGRLLVYTTAEALITADTNNVADVYLYDFQSASNRLVSRGYTAPVGNAASDSPTISPEGRFVSWCSRASNLVPGDTNTTSDVFLYDRESDGVFLLSVSGFADLPANDHSSYPVFSDDGTTIVFRSWATDLLDADFNQAGDLFVVNLLTSSPAVPFAVQIMMPAAGQVTLTWPAVWGNRYRVEYQDDLDDGAWLNLNCTITHVGDRAWATDLQAGSAKRVYRIQAY